MSVLPGYPSYTKIPFRNSRLYQRQKKGRLNLERALLGNKEIISGNMRTHPAIRASFCLLDRAREKEALP